MSWRGMSDQILASDVYAEKELLENQFVVYPDCKSYHRFAPSNNCLCGRCIRVDSYVFYRTGCLTVFEGLLSKTVILVYMSYSSTARLLHGTLTELFLHLRLFKGIPCLRGGKSIMEGRVAGSSGYEILC